MGEQKPQRQKGPPREIYLGMPYRFIPAAFIEFRDPKRVNGAGIACQVTGHVTYINQAHRYFTVEYEVNGVRLAESFKF